MKRINCVNAMLAIGVFCNSAVAGGGCAADVDGSGTVNANDVLAVLNDYCLTNFQRGGAPLQTDITADGRVDLLDAILVSRCIGVDCDGPCLVPPLSGFPGVHFRLDVVDMGGCPASGSMAQATANGQAFYQHVLGGDTPPTPAAVSSDVNRGYETYVAAGPQPVSAGGLAPLSILETVTFTPSSMAGQWGGATLSGGPALAHSRPAPVALPAFGVQSVFVGRFTTPRGVGLKRCPVRVAMTDAAGVHWVTVRLNSAPAEVDSLGHPLTRRIALRGFIAAQPTIAGFGPADVFDMYVTSDAAGGDNDGTFCISFNDITQVLTNWLANFAPCSGPGDANGDGIVNFADVTYTLNFFHAPYVCL